MKPFSLALAAALTFALGAPLHAENADPLWNKAKAQAELVKKWVPEDLAMDVDAIADGKHDKAKTRSHLKGWDGSKPLYDTVQIEPKPDPAKQKDKIHADMNDASNMGDELMHSNAPVRRSDNQLLHGKSWTLFELSQSKGPMDVSLKMWVDPLTGIAHQTESKVHGTFMMDMVLTTTYQPHPKAGSLPERNEFMLKVLVPFTDAKVHMTNTMDHWIPRPN